MPTLETYDKSAAFFAVVLPLVKQLQEACSEHNLPIALVIPYSQDGEQAGICVVAGGSQNRAPQSVWKLIELLQDVEVFHAAMHLIHSIDEQAEMGALFN